MTDTGSPTILEFALRYRMPVSAEFGAEFESLSIIDRKAAFGGIEAYHAHCVGRKMKPADPHIYLQLKIWQRLGASQPTHIPFRSRHAGVRPYVEKALPAFDAPMMTAKEIHEAHGYGAPITTRRVLSELVDDGIAEYREMPPVGACAPTRMYRRASL